MRSLDVFCGAGGLTLGLQQAGWQSVAGIDHDPDACRTFRANFPAVTSLLADARTVDFSVWRGVVQLVAGGPPCQPFSVAGKGNAARDERDGVPAFIRAVREISPEAFLIENVFGLTTTRHRDYLDAIVQALTDLGYQVMWRVLDAADYGVPQHRRRLFVVGLRSAPFEFPAPTHGPGRAHPYVTAREALAGCPEDEPNRAIVTYARNPILRPQPFDGMLVNGGGRPINPDEPCQTIPASAGGNRTHIWDPAGVLIAYHAHLMTGGAPRSGQVTGVRRLTARESARIQSFPDEFVFLGTTSTRYRLIGNAVPPALARVIGHVIREQMTG